MQGQGQGPPQQPGRAPYKSDQQSAQNYGAQNNSFQPQRRPPIQGGGGGRGSTMASNVAAINNSGGVPIGGYPNQRQPIPVNSQPAYGFQGYEAQAPMHQQAYAPMFNQARPPMRPQQQMMNQPAGRRPPVPTTNQPQYGTEMVENQQSLQMPATVQNEAVSQGGVATGRQPQAQPLAAQYAHPQTTTVTVTTQIQSLSIHAHSQQQQHAHPHSHPHPHQQPLGQSTTGSGAQPLTTTTITTTTTTASGKSARGPITAAAIAGGLATAPTSAQTLSVKSRGTEEQARAASGGPLTTGSKKAMGPAPWVNHTGAKKNPISHGWATVRQVLSADTFRLALFKSPKQQSGPATIITFTLEGIRTPRVARTAKAVDQPYGFEAREFVRKRICSGGPVFYAAWNMTKEENPPRYHGDIYFSLESKQSNEAKPNRESLTSVLVANGYADLNMKEKTQLSPTEHERLIKALERAKKLGLGKFADGGAATAGTGNEEDKKQENNEKNAGGNKKKGGKQNTHVRRLEWIRTPEERKKLFQKYQNKEIPAIVEQVWSGSTLRVELLPSGKDAVHEIVPINLAGCTAPRSRLPMNEEEEKKENKNKNARNAATAATATANTTNTANTANTATNAAANKAPTWSNEAKEFTEERLLSQQVTVKIVATDPKFNLYAVVSHPKGQIALSLLRAGFAEYESWTAQLLEAKDQKELKEAVKSAQAKRIHIWQHKKPDSMSQDFVPAIITSIISGDTFMAQFADGREERFTLSSIRQPRYKEETNTKQPQGQQNQPRKEGGGKDNTTHASSPYADHPWVRPAKEFLRRKLIGKEVQLLCEYTKESKNEMMILKGLKVQKFATVLVDKENVAVSLVRAGLAEVIQHRQEDHKSMAYLELQKAAEKAKSGKKGMYSNQQPEEIVDYSADLQFTKPNVIIDLQNFLKSQRRKAVVEYVFSGHRMKVYLPDKHCFLPLGLAYVRCDPYSTAQKTQKYQKNQKMQKTQSEAGRAAFEHVKQRLLQRDIEIEFVELMDQAGRPTWLAKVWIDGKDLGLELLEKGLAQIIIPRALKQTGPRRPNVTPNVPSGYLQAEAQAREQQVGGWKTLVAKEKEREDERKKNNKTGQEKTVVVSQIDSAVKFWVNLAGNNELEKLEAQMSRIPDKKAGKIRPGKMVAALYDGLYCRAKVAQRDSRSNNMWFVIFVDYGNRASIAEENMAQLPRELDLERWPQLAQRCQLAALRSPPRTSEYFNVSGEYFAGLVMPGQASKSLVKELKIKILWDDFRQRKWYVVLMDQNTNINEQMVKEGYARFDNKGKETVAELFKVEDEFTSEYIRTVKRLNDEALESRRGLWELGDISSGEEEY